MADEFYRTFTASGNLDNQYSFIKMESDDTVGQAGANEKAVGVLQNTASDGESAVVKVAGISKIEVNESCAVGKYVTATASGTAEVVDAADEHAVGMMIKEGDTQGDIGKLVISPFEASSTDA